MSRKLRISLPVSEVPKEFLLSLLFTVGDYNPFTMKDLVRHLAHLSKWLLFILELFYDVVLGVFTLELP